MAPVSDDLRHYSPLSRLPLVGLAREVKAEPADRSHTVKKDRAPTLL
ncbi:hypothetical protein THAOC_05971, partial [Thalassiosira oceanica]